jgi:hypothetical protein
MHYEQEDKYYSCSLYNDKILKTHNSKLGDIKILTSRASVAQFLKGKTSVTFNGKSYDDPILDLFLSHASNYQLKTASDEIIQSRLMPWIFRRKYNLKELNVDKIDLINVAAGIASLKSYGARLGLKKLQELPIPHYSIIKPNDVDVLFDYCVNDLTVTKALYYHYESDINLRIDLGEKYQSDFRSRSDPQIAEDIFKIEYVKRTGVKLARPSNVTKEFYFDCQKFIKFKSPELNDLLNICKTQKFSLSAKNKLTIPRKISKVLNIGDKSYKMGIGGLHSKDEPGAYFSSDLDNATMLEIDVAGMYPNTIIHGGWCPDHIGNVYQDIYTELVNVRTQAKKDLLTETNPDKIKELNVTIAMVKLATNGAYGKSGSIYSVLVAFNLLLNTTLTGQLSLLMIIEQLTLYSIEILSANTDGIVVIVSNSQRDAFKCIVKQWEELTGYTMEETIYKKYVRRDVNNYFAVKEDGSIKRKGVFKPTDISKNNAFQIIYDAVIDNMVHRIPIEETIHQCEDINKFLMLKKVTGGAHKDGVKLGGTVRFYRSMVTLTAINYCKNDNKVGSSDNCNPLMDLPESLPDDLDYDFYIDSANDLLLQIFNGKENA